MLNDKIIAVVGLGYVGLPLAIAFGKRLTTIGYDVSETKIARYKAHFDPASEVAQEEFLSASKLEFTTDPAALKRADFVVVAVPTPVDNARTPDLTPLISASETVGSNLRVGTTVIFESTVYPGTTEDICVPVLERESGLKWCRDFFVGYSPERINPGDKERTLEKITKVVSGDSPDTLSRVAALYRTVITAGVFEASSIKVAEAAKVIENTQRDLNIALINELALIFKRLGIDTEEVLRAARTKWNFLDFRPGLVGGHCIGVDPYYLTFKAQQLDYHPEVILAGRRLNDGMARFIAQETIKMIAKNSGSTADKGSTVNVLGLTFKENCSDVRNSKVIDLIEELRAFGCQVRVHDPLASPEEVFQEYGLRLSSWHELERADALVFAVPHRGFLDKSPEVLMEKVKASGVVIDVKSLLPKATVEQAGFRIWRL